MQRYDEHTVMSLSVYVRRKYNQTIVCLIGTAYFVFGPRSVNCLALPDIDSMIVDAVEDVDVYVGSDIDIDVEAVTNIDVVDTNTNIVKTFSLHLTEQSLIISHLFFRNAWLPFSRTQ